jgi:hypothetical protein
MQMAERECDAELLALKPKFDEVFDDWWRRTEARAEYQDALDAELVRRTGMTSAQYNELERGSAEALAYSVERTVLIESDTIEHRYQPRVDDEIDQDANRLYGLVYEVLGHRAYTREGLRLQCRAMIIDSYDERHGKEWEFVASVATFLRMHDLPDALMADLYDWKFEDDEEEDGDDGRPDHWVGPSKGPTTKGAGHEQA